MLTEEKKNLCACLPHDVKKSFCTNCCATTVNLRKTHRVNGEVKWVPSVWSTDVELLRWPTGGLIRRLPWRRPTTRTTAQDGVHCRFSFPRFFGTIRRLWRLPRLQSYARWHGLLEGELLPVQTATYSARATQFRPPCRPRSRVTIAWL